MVPPDRGASYQPARQGWARCPGAAMAGQGGRPEVGGRAHCGGRRKESGTGGAPDSGARDFLGGERVRLNRAQACLPMSSAGWRRYLSPCWGGRGRGRDGVSRPIVGGG